MAERSIVQTRCIAITLLLFAACSGAPKPELADRAGGGEEVAEVDEAAAATTLEQVGRSADADEPIEQPGIRELGTEDELPQHGEAEEAATENDPAALLGESLAAYESAGSFWQQGAFDDAVAALDHAFGRMAQVPSNGDEVLAQEKDNLRQLISRKLVEIYASRQSAVGDPNGSIPLVDNEDVARQIRSFQGRERQFFLDSYRRSGLYRPMILDRLREAGLPEQLSWLPLVESGFKDRALSSARALGLWQFIASTGYRYGLERSDWVDERMDPEKSTRAAIDYLTALHNLFGDWLTALAAYNCGEHNVLKQIQRQSESYFDQFWDLYGRLPRETRSYVPRFLAVLAILEDPTAYGFELPEPEAPLAREVVEIARASKLESMDRALGLEVGTLARLNPELRRNATPPTPYRLQVPPGHGETLLASVEALPTWTPPQESIHRVRSGETLSGIAARYRTSVRELMALNRLRNAHRISPGQQLRVPGGAVPVRVASALAPGSVVQHTVRTGDSLWLLASRYGTTVEKIRVDNALASSLLRPGQVLEIRGPEGSGGNGSGAGGAVYVVESGDTLGSIARRRGVALARLLAANRLSERSTIYPGQQLTIPD